jgi:hypothetical protein
MASVGAPVVLDHARLHLDELPVRSHANSSGICWSAIFAGAFVAAALALALLALGAGMGLSALSPWSNDGVSGSAVGKAAIMWFIFAQIIASAMGGYLAGRLRTKWVSVHTDEVHFRDTAHGLTVWAVGLVITAAFLTSAAATMVGRSAAQQAPMGVQDSARTSASNAYFVDSLFRSGHPSPDASDTAERAEASTIFSNALLRGAMPATDRIYLGQLVSARTGLGQSDSEMRVTESFADAQKAVDSVRKSIAHSLYWLFLALLIGAFTASGAATIGGKQRDRVIVV